MCTIGLIQLKYLLLNKHIKQTLFNDYHIIKIEKTNILNKTIHF